MNDRGHMVFSDRTVELIGLLIENWVWIITFWDFIFSWEVRCIAASCVWGIFILNIIEITRTTKWTVKCKGYRKPCTPLGQTMRLQLVWYLQLKHGSHMSVQGSSIQTHTGALTLPQLAVVKLIQLQKPSFRQVWVRRKNEDLLPTWKLKINEATLPSSLPKFKQKITTSKHGMDFSIAKPCSSSALLRSQAL